MSNDSNTKELLEEDHSSWATFTPEDLAFLENLKEFIDQQELKQQKELEFHQSVWFDAFDQTGAEFFAWDPAKKPR